MTSYYPSSSYKAPVRQEGFHLPSPAPSNGNNPPSPPQNFDINNQLYMPQLLSDPFRKFSGDASAPSMDFSDELASLIAHSPTPHANHQSSHERSTQSPVSTGSANGYDDNSYRSSTIFDISASTASHSQHQHQPNHNGYQNQFPLSPGQAQQQPGSYHPTIHEFTPHPNFNSTLPALNSTMRYDPQPPTTHDQAYAPHFPPQPADYPHVRHSPSPVGFASSVSRSRSRSRAPPTTSEPPSTNGGPARTMRHKRNSISSTSPPPHHRTQAIVIPSHRAASQHTPTSATSPLSLHSLSTNTTSGWFVPSQQQQHEFRPNEFSLPTPESVGTHHGFSQFNPGSVGSGVNLGVSPKDVTAGKGLSAVESEEDTGSKQSVAMLAVEKRRKRRESHNAVERRRRDNINERIAELATLIPEVMLDQNAPVTSRSGDDFLFGITGISGLSNPLGIEGLISLKKDDDDKDDELNDVTTPGKKGGGTNGTHTEGGIVKANKGMILRKSVEYIKYLQQLVSAQGSRNRDLEQELAGYRQGRSRDTKPVNGIDATSKKHRRFVDPEDMNGLVLHDEVDDGRFVNMNGLNGYSKSTFRGLGLGSMPEEDHDMDMEGRRTATRLQHDTDNLDDRPSTSGMDTLTPPSAGSGSLDGEDDGSELSGEMNRGRDRTIRCQKDSNDGQIKIKNETEDMET